MPKCGTAVCAEGGAAASGILVPRVRELWAVGGRDDGHGREGARPSAWDRTVLGLTESAPGTPYEPIPVPAPRAKTNIRNRPKKTDDEPETHRKQSRDEQKEATPTVTEMVHHGHRGFQRYSSRSKTRREFNMLMCVHLDGRRQRREGGGNMGV